MRKHYRFRRQEFFRVSITETKIVQAPINIRYFRTLLCHRCLLFSGRFGLKTHEALFVDLVDKRSIAFRYHLAIDDNMNPIDS